MTLKPIPCLIILALAFACGFLSCWFWQVKQSQARLNIQVWAGGKIVNEVDFPLTFKEFAGGEMVERSE